MTTEQTKEKQRAGAIKMHARRTDTEKDTIRQKLVRQAFSRYAKLKNILENDPCCLNCAYYAADNPETSDEGDCRHSPPPFERVTFDTFCGGCVPIDDPKPVKGKGKRHIEVIAGKPSDEDAECEVVEVKDDPADVY